MFNSAASQIPFKQFACERTISCVFHRVSTQLVVPLAPVAAAVADLPSDRASLTGRHLVDTSHVRVVVCNAQFFTANVTLQTAIAECSCHRPVLPFAMVTGIVTTL